MEDIAAQVIEFQQFFKQDAAMQQAYLEDPIGFMQNPAVPSAWAAEVAQISAGIAAGAKALQQGGSLDSIPGPDSVWEEDLLTGPVKGKPLISLQSTSGAFGIITGYYLVLNNQATDDVSDGLLIGAALAGLIFAADPEVLSKAAAGVIAGALTVEAGAMKLMNRGKGVYFYINPLLMIALVTPAAPLAVIQLVPLPN